MDGQHPGAGGRQASASPSGATARRRRHRRPRAKASTTRRGRGTRLTAEVLADTVTGLLWLEDRYRRDIEAMNRVPAAAPEQEHDADYPDVIVIDDEDDEDLAVA